MEIRLEKPALSGKSEFKSLRVAKVRNQTGGFEVKNFSCTYSLFKVNRSMKSKIIKYGIILLHKYEVEQAGVISRLPSSLFYHKLRERLVRQNIYIYLIHFHTSSTVTISRAQEIFIQLHFQSIQRAQSKLFIKLL